MSGEIKRLEALREWYGAEGPAEAIRVLLELAERAEAIAEEYAYAVPGLQDWLRDYKAAKGE